MSSSFRNSMIFIVYFLRQVAFYVPLMKLYVNYLRRFTQNGTIYAIEKT